MVLCRRCFEATKARVNLEMGTHALIDEKEKTLLLTTRYCPNGHISVGRIYITPKGREDSPEYVMVP